MRPLGRLVSPSLFPPRRVADLKILFRADASLAIGGGHVMRCLTLAEELNSRGAEIAFACAHITDTLAMRIREKGYALHLLEQTYEPGVCAEGAPPLSREAQQQDARRTADAAGIADWVIVDHYRLDANWLECFGQGVSRLVIDDLANRPQQCEILVDQTLGRTAAEYGALVPDHCRVLAGSQYALLRREFLDRRAASLAEREPETSIGRVLISLGLGDAGGVSAAALEAVESTNLPLEIDLIIGSGATRLTDLQAKAATDPKVHLHVDTRNMADLMTRCDIAIGAAGSTSWERCCLGLPTIALILAENQRLVAENLERAGAIIIADGVEAITPILESLSADRGKRFSLSAAAAAITEGLGSRIIADHVYGLAQTPSEIRVRRAQPDDSRLAWLWRNDPATRMASQSTEPIIWPDHRRWWQEKLLSTDCELLMAELDLAPVGIIRFDRKSEGVFEVSINLSPSRRGSGLGEPVLHQACSTFLDENPGARLIATIRSNNLPSQHIFERLGFVRVGALPDPSFEIYERPEGVMQ